MFIFLSIVFTIVFLIVGAGATHGYAKHRWPSNYNNDEEARVAATILWPFYWVFIWPFTKVNEVTFSGIEKLAGKQVAKNKARIADLHATREMIAKSNAELDKAEAELEEEIAKEKIHNV